MLTGAADHDIPVGLRDSVPAAKRRHQVGSGVNVQTLAHDLEIHAVELQELVDLQEVVTFPGHVRVNARQWLRALDPQPVAGQDGAPARMLSRARAKAYTAANVGRDTVDFRDITQATEGEGSRVYKWPYDPNRVTTNHGNDFPIFRLAEMYLIKAEAANEMGNSAEAIALINEVRERVFDPDKPLSAGLSQQQVRDALLDERLFELMDEAKRRADLVRHGKWTDAWYEKPEQEPYRVLMPIPQTQLDANPLLEQNPGY